MSDRTIGVIAIVVGVIFGLSVAAVIGPMIKAEMDQHVRVQMWTDPPCNPGEVEVLSTPSPGDRTGPRRVACVAGHYREK